METKAGHRICISLLSAVSVLTAFSASCQASFDSLRLHLPKHYFNTVIVADFYNKPTARLDTQEKVSMRIREFGVRQVYLSFYTPLQTRIFTGPDSAIKNTHLLLTGNFYSFRPLMGGLDHQHRLVKNGIGIRYIYNTGKKEVWFFDLSPFVTRDASHRTKPYLRMASTIVYSRNENASFNWRIGITKSFVWGNRYYLPFVGLRFGRLDKVNLSIQFPRNIQLNMPLGDKVILSLYSRPQGGVFYFSNHDSIYFQSSEKAFHFTRYELNTGLRADVRIGDRFGFYLSPGISSRNNITFYGEPANRLRRNKTYNRYFYSADVPPTLFINAGLVLKLGRTRSYFNDRNIYDAIDLNNTIEGNGNIQIPLKPRKLRSDYNLETIQDLVDYAEL